MIEELKKKMAEQAKQITDASPCRWCGKSLGEHLDSLPPGGAIPPVPCLGLKSEFSGKPVVVGCPSLEVPIDPLFSKSPDEARESVIQDAFSWGVTNRVIGQQIWDRARAYERYFAERIKETQ